MSVFVNIQLCTAKFKALCTIQVGKRQKQQCAILNTGHTAVPENKTILYTGGLYLEKSRYACEDDFRCQSDKIHAGELGYYDDALAFEQAGEGIREVKYCEQYS